MEEESRRLIRPHWSKSGAIGMMMASAFFAVFHTLTGDYGSALAQVLMFCASTGLFYSQRFIRKAVVL